MASGKRKIFAFSMALLAFCSGLFCFLNREKIEFPLLKFVQVESPYLVRDYGGRRYILDKQRSRILVVDKSSGVLCHVLPGRIDEADRFYYADDFTVDENGFVYVKEGAWDGNRISREAVLAYDKQGRYRETFLDWRHSDVVNKHKLLLLFAGKGIINSAVKDKSGVIVQSYDIKSQVLTKKKIPFENAFDWTADMTQDLDGNIFLLDKTGRLFVLPPDGSAFSLVWTCESGDFPNWIEPSSPGKILYADLYSDCLVELDWKSGEKKVVMENCGAVTVTPAAFSSIENPQKESKTFRFQCALLLCAALFALSLLALLATAAAAFVQSKIHVIQRISVYVVLIVLAVSGTITYRLAAEFSKVMKGQILAQMENLAYSVANTIRPAALDSINSAADFNSPAYREMIKNMEKVIDLGLEINRNIYCDVFKYEPSRGAYACAYLDQAIGSYFPLTEGESEEIKEIYKTALPVRSSKDDSSASYAYVSVPVTSDLGEVHGVVSVMTENFMLVDKVNAMKKSVLFGVVVTVILIWLLMGEALSYILSKSQAQMEAEEKKAAGLAEEKAFPHYYIRLMVFALFAAYNMTTTFLPMVVAKSAFESLGKGSSSLAAALPISVNLFIIGLMALFCQGAISRFGVKKTMLFGALLSAASNLIIFALPLAYAALFFAFVIDGIGVGLTTNSMYLLVSKIPDPKNRTSGYAAYNGAQVSGINFGMLFGAALASSVGRREIFPIVSAMWILSALVFLLLVRSIGVFSESEKSGAEKQKRERGGHSRPLGFLRRRRIWSFILFVQAPFALMGSFVYYYLPLYSDANGLSEVAVAVLMMLYSMFAIYLGDGLTKFVIQKAGSASSFAPVALSALAVLIYAALGNFPGLLLAIFILGLANGFGRSVQQSEFSTFNECEEYGVPEAMGIFNFTDFIGQSFGPALMGLVFLSGNAFVRAVVFALVLVFLRFVHSAINLRKKKNFK